VSLRRVAVSTPRSVGRIRPISRALRRPLCAPPQSLQHTWGPVALGTGLALSFALIGTFLATVGAALGLDPYTFRSIGAAVLALFGSSPGPTNPSRRGSSIEHPTGSPHSAPASEDVPRAMAKGFHERRNNPTPWSV
jgi:hypothetical protein